ncbi:MAG TPA: glycosyltransferase family 4 protein [Candidatus Polarisedimenticolia bacterium]|nr:glycosyltransferase family 4 protein [Candidatus Polarisedimenticolia bacterium]
MTTTQRATLPRLCFVGPMVGFNPGQVVTQGVRLSGHFRGAGYSALAVSASTNRYVRLLDIVATLIRRRRQIDILIVHVYGGPSFVVEDIASRLGRMFGVRIIMLLHGGAFPEFMGRFPRWARRVLRRADLLVAPSPFLARAVGRFGFACRVIPNVIDLPAYPYRRRTVLCPRLFWMRTFDPDYNPLMAIEVLSGIRASFPDATLVMGGQDKGMLADVRRRAKELGIEGAVRFPGFLDMAAKAREGSAADVFINTNRVDNMPVAVVEACAMGIPVVTTSVGGVPDLISDGRTGLLVPDGDAGAMVAAVERLLGDPGLAATLSDNGRRLAERSAWDSVRLEWESIFAGLRPRPTSS